MKRSATAVVNTAQQLSRREAELEKTRSSLKRWHTRLKRAAGMIGRLTAKEKRLVKALAYGKAMTDTAPKPEPKPKPKLQHMEQMLGEAIYGKPERPRGMARLAHLAEDLPKAALEAGQDQGIFPKPAVSDVTDVDVFGMVKELNDGLDVPTFLKEGVAERDRNRKLQAMPDPRTKEKKAERKAIAKEKQQADLTGKRRKMPLTGKAALDAIRKG
ncbi:MAG: hypothetical protein C5B60_00140 [Chloroflexi bacterium]|nr:MAG: hypothetical protein C5B60_00140 [Chloroflexota bacterium]